MLYEGGCHVPVGSLLDVYPAGEEDLIFVSAIAPWILAPFVQKEGLEAAHVPLPASLPPLSHPGRPMGQPARLNPARARYQLPPVNSGRDFRVWG